jgi:hypothetical protein
MPLPKVFANNAERQRAYRMRQKHKPKPDPVALKTASINSIPSTARWKSLREQALSALQSLQNEMQAYLDDRSEVWQESERGMTFQDKIESVEDVTAALQDVEI